MGKEPPLSKRALEYHELAEEIEQRTEARRLLYDALRDGVIHKPDTCALCGGKPVQAHHTDYGRPLDVEWLCRTCHGYAHGVGIMPEPSVSQHEFEKRVRLLYGSWWDERTFMKRLELGFEVAKLCHLIYCNPGLLEGKRLNHNLGKTKMHWLRQTYEEFLDWDNCFLDK